MSRCYIAGPMRGIPNLNRPAFYAAEAALLAAGWDRVFNPARMDDELDGRVVENGTPASWRHYAKRDLAVLIDTLRGEAGDAVVLLPGWQNSKGANAEYCTALWVGLRVLNLEDAIKEVVQ